MNTRHLKTVKVTNPKNTLVQIPRVITDLWGLKEGDSVDVVLDETTGKVILTPKEGYITIRKIEN